MEGGSNKYDTTVTITYNGEEFTIDTEEVIECEHCGYVWGTMSQMRRPSCPDCGGHTDRNVRGKYYETYLKYGLFSGDEETVEEVTEALQFYAQLFEALEDNGWNFDCTTRSSHVAFSKGDVEPQDIRA